jgi:parallel beta-helix repeat protein
MIGTRFAQSLPRLTGNQQRLIGYSQEMSSSWGFQMKNSHIGSCPKGSRTFAFTKCNKTVNMFRFVVFVAVILAGSLFIVKIAGAATYYVDATSGIDTNNGLSTDAAWKTINKVSTSSFNAGDSILFKRGETWREQLAIPSSGTSGHPITFGAYGHGAKPTISASDLIAGWAENSANTWKVALTTKPKQVFFNGVRGTLKTSVASLMSKGDWCWRSGVLYVYSITDPDSAYVYPGIEVSKRNSSIVGIAKHYVIIKNLLLRNGNTANVDVSGTGVIITSNEICGAYYHGMRANSLSAACNNWLISNNTVHHNGATGITLFPPAERCLITGNTVYRNAQLAIDADHNYSGGIRLCTTAGLTYNIVEHNKVYDNGVGGMSGGVQRGCGIWFDTVGTGNIIRYNLVYRNRMMGIKLDLDTHASEVYYNIVYGHLVVTGHDGAIYGTGIGVDGTSRGSKICNNTVYGNRYGIRIAGCFPGQTNDVLNVIVKNNISVNNTVSQFVAALGGDNDGTHGSGNIYERNCFGVKATKFVGWGLNTYKSTYTDWETAYGGNTHSVQANPLFVNGAQNEFRLQSASPCIDAGTNVGLTHDYHGTTVPQGNGIDIGAIEFVPATRIAPPGNRRKYSDQ